MRMLTIRLQRVGKRNNPAFRVVLMDARRSAKSGDFLEILGSHNPRRKSLFSIKKDRVSHWLSKGAQPSDTIHNLLVREKVIDAPKRNVVAPSKLKKSEPATSQSEASLALEGREKTLVEASGEVAAEQPVEKIKESKKQADADTAAVIEESPPLEKGE